MSRYIVVLLFIWTASAGAVSDFTFLNIATGPVSGALGESGISHGNGADQLLLNPAAVVEVPQSFTTFSYGSFPAGIHQFAVVGCAPRLFQQLPLLMGVNGINYGTLTETDIWGNVTGDFPAVDYQFFLGSGVEIAGIRVGGAVKWIHGTIAQYSSSALALDLGVRYHWYATNLDLGVVFANQGKVLKEYTSGSRQTLPGRLALGVSKRLRYLPLRWQLDFGWLEGAEDLRGGLEFSLPHSWFLRSGYVVSVGADRLDSLDETLRGLTLGFGGGFLPGWSFAYSYSSLGELGGINRLSVHRDF